MTAAGVMSLPAISIQMRFRLGILIGVSGLLVTVLAMIWPGLINGSLGIALAPIMGGPLMGARLLIGITFLAIATAAAYVLVNPVQKSAVLTEGSTISFHCFNCGRSHASLHPDVDYMEGVVRLRCPWCWTPLRTRNLRTPDNKAMILLGDAADLTFAREETDTEYLTRQRAFGGDTFRQDTDEILNRQPTYTAPPDLKAATQELHRIGAPPPPKGEDLKVPCRRCGDLFKDAGSVSAHQRRTDDKRCRNVPLPPELIAHREAEKERLAKKADKREKKDGGQTNAIVPTESNKGEEIGPPGASEGPPEDQSSIKNDADGTDQSPGPGETEVEVETS